MNVSAPSSSTSSESIRTASLRHSVRDGCFHAVMMGAGEAYLSPFAILLGAQSVLLGLLGSLPLLLGSFAQLASVRALERFPRRRLLVTVPAVLQALTWIGIFAVPVLVSPEAAPLALLLCAIPYFALGSFGVPPWSSWMGDLVPEKRRGEFFGRRDRLRTFAQLGALLAGGVLLDVLSSRGFRLTGFACLFGAAALARLVSAFELWRTTEPPYVATPRDERITFRVFLRALGTSRFGNVTLYVTLIQLTSQISGPFFALYMLRDVGLSYLEFTAASATCFLAQALTFHNWGKLADRVGGVFVLRVTGLLIPVVPILWLFSARFEAILVYQLFSGVVWAGFNLSAANAVFDHVPPPARPRSVAFYYLFVNGGMLVGSMIGGVLVPFLPETLSVGSLSVTFFSSLQVLFLLSGTLRMVVTIAFVPILRSLRVSRGPGPWRVAFGIVGLQPIRGPRFSVFTPRAETTEPEAVAATEPPEATRQDSSAGDDDPSPERL